MDANIARTIAKTNTPKGEVDSTKKTELDEVILSLKSSACLVAIAGEQIERVQKTLERINHP